jgi:uncharacterized protein (TIGR02466 family)
VTAPARITSLFPTLIYRAEIAAGDRALAKAVGILAEQDRDGRRWCRRHGYVGYTSYASIDDLAARDPAFARLETAIERHAARFAKSLHWDLRGGVPRCDSMWVNRMPEGGSHTGHIHTNAVLSGTYYVTAPEGASPLVFEDPRLPLLMAAPPRRPNAPREFQTQVSERPRAGTLLLWESWLRHEVPLNRSTTERISISFNLIIGVSPRK